MIRLFTSLYITAYCQHMSHEAIHFIVQSSSRIFRKQNNLFLFKYFQRDSHFVKNNILLEVVSRKGEENGTYDFEIWVSATRCSNGW
jgi:hypothetical protein